MNFSLVGLSGRCIFTLPADGKVSSVAGNATLELFTDSTTLRTPKFESVKSWTLESLFERADLLAGHVIADC
ncbi:hypothetical protein ACO0LG_20430 [Undibacterium sp. Ji42W]|uniref:hypothetical protein n=1 Tax=Undibacterium sp. Ji42W TaxID=3413039 RepID=UPI003BF3585B